MLQVDQISMYAGIQIRVVGPDQGVAKVPGVLGAQVVFRFKAQGSQILDGKHDGNPGVAPRQRDGSAKRRK